MGHFRSEYDLGTISNTEISFVSTDDPYFYLFLEIYVSLFIDVDKPPSSTINNGDGVRLSGRLCVSISH